MSNKRQLEPDDECQSDEQTTTKKSRKIETNDDDAKCIEKPKFPKILDGKYYKVEEYDKETDFVGAKCLSCTKKINIIRGKRTTTGNFHTHYARIHSEIADDVKNYCDEKKDDKLKDERKSISSFAKTLDSAKVIVKYCYNTAKFE